MIELTFSEIEEVSGGCGGACIGGLFIGGYGAGLATGQVFWGN